MSRYNPWRQLRHAFPHIALTTNQGLPEGRAGSQTSDRIYLHRRLGQCGRRCTLTHELVHKERGTICTPDQYTREEAIVDEIAARRLITVDQLVDALLWTSSLAGAEAADELWCNDHMLHVRLCTLTAAEHADITDEIRRRQPW
ncbi:hypothetical protein [Rhodococcus jostii]|uniref:hypothetical protein n=1 Tax=Rhodococcus jostii TaxID=132919 RepID=UPI00363E652C